jgi:hypothetical protein
MRIAELVRKSIAEERRQTRLFTDTSAKQGKLSQKGKRFSERLITVQSSLGKEE